MTDSGNRAMIRAFGETRARLVRIYVARFHLRPDPLSERDNARLGEIQRTIDAIEAAGMAVVEADDGR
jgi:hypothetical protein